METPPDARRAPCRDAPSDRIEVVDEDFSRYRARMYRRKEHSFSFFNYTRANDRRCWGCTVVGSWVGSQDQCEIVVRLSASRKVIASRKDVLCGLLILDGV